MSDQLQPPESPSPSFFGGAGGKRGLIVVFILVALLVIPIKVFFFSDPGKSFQPFVPKEEEVTKPLDLKPREETKGNPLIFGGMLQAVKDSEDVTRNQAYWTVLQAVEKADPQPYNEAPLFLEQITYNEIMANPKQLRLMGTPVKMVGLISDWYSEKVETNQLGRDFVYRTWLQDGRDHFYVFDGLTQPPVNRDEMNRVVVEVTGIFYQVYLYETATTLEKLFAMGVRELKRGRNHFALEEFQKVLEQDPDPVEAAQWVRWVDPDLWKYFSNQGPEYKAVVERFDLLAKRGLESSTPEAAAKKKHFQREVPFFLAKDIRLLNPPGPPSAFSNFMNSTMGLVTAGVVVLVMVGAFFFLFLKLQKDNEEMAKKQRENFWRQVRRNVKGVTPPESGPHRGRQGPPGDDPKRFGGGGGRGLTT